MFGRFTSDSVAFAGMIGTGGRSGERARLRRMRTDTGTTEAPRVMFSSSCVGLQDSALRLFVSGP